MLALLKNYIKTIFLSTDVICKDDQIVEIMGVSKTNPYDYGVIHTVIGKSLTDLADYSNSAYKCVDISYDNESGQDVHMNDFETISLNDYDEDNVDLEEEKMSLTIDESIQSDDFENLESILKEGTEDDVTILTNASGTLGKLKCSGLYKSLQNSEEVRNKISALLDRVSVNQTTKEKSEKESCLLDMSEFINT